MDENTCSDAEFWADAFQRSGAGKAETRVEHVILIVIIFFFSPFSLTIYI